MKPMPIRRRMRIRLSSWHLIAGASLFAFFSLNTAMLSVYSSRGQAHAAVDPAKSITAPLDLIFVIDNSGSMKSYDPGFITRDALLTFFPALPDDTREQTRVAIVVYDETARLVQPLSRIRDSQMRAQFEESVERIDFTGQWTNSPAGIERAIYELETNSTPGADKAIIFMTDGIIDTGDPNRDQNSHQWLREELTEASRKAGIQIYGIAFTDAADFQLIQALSLKTHGNYYRAYTADELPGVFDKLFARLRDNRDRDRVAAEVSATGGAPAGPAKGGAPATSAPPIEARFDMVEATPHSEPLPTTRTPEDQLESLAATRDRQRWFAGFFLFAAMGSLVYSIQRHRAQLSAKASQASAHIVTLPDLDDEARAGDRPSAMLIGGPDDSIAIDIPGGHLTVGRGVGNDLVIAEETISSTHATIDFRRGYFYLEDHRSTNGTRLNEKRLAPNNPVELKSGDRILFANSEFTFLISDHAPLGDTVLVSERPASAAIASPNVTHHPSAPLSPESAAIDAPSAFRGELQADLARIRAISPAHDEFISSEFSEELRQRLAVTVDDMIRPSLMTQEGKRAMFARNGVLFVLCVVTGDRQHAAQWFSEKFGGFANLISESMQSEIFHENDCHVLCVVTFGRARDGWVSTSIATRKDYPDPIETLAEELLSGVERRLLDLD